MHDATPATVSDKAIAPLVEALIGVRKKQVNSISALLIMLLVRQGRSNLSAMAARTGQTTASLTGIVDTLERFGLADRVSDRVDRRNIFLELTPEGTALVDSVLFAYSSHEKHEDTTPPRASTPSLPA